MLCGFHKMTCEVFHRLNMNLTGEKYLYIYIQGELLTRTYILNGNSVQKN